MRRANSGFPHIFCTKRLANRIRSLYVTGLGQRCFPQRPADQAPVAQLDRAPDYESGGQRFESFRARHFLPYITSGKTKVRGYGLVRRSLLCVLPGSWVLNLGGWSDTEVVELGSNLRDRSFQLQADHRYRGSFPREGQKSLNGLVIPVFRIRVHGRRLHVDEVQPSAASAAR
jgi:hypothetical protein